MSAVPGMRHALAPTEIRRRLRRFIRQNFLGDAGAAVLDDGASLQRMHVVDSTNLIELILYIEEAFGTAVRDEDLVPENFDTVDALVAYLHRSLSGAHRDSGL